MVLHDLKPSLWPDAECWIACLQVLLRLDAQFLGLAILWILHGGLTRDSSLSDIIRWLPDSLFVEAFWSLGHALIRCSVLS